MRNITKTLILVATAVVISACGDGSQKLSKADATFKNSQTSVKSFTCTLSSWDNYLLEDDTCTDTSGVCVIKNVPLGKYRLLCKPTAASSKVALMDVDKVILVKSEDISLNEWELDFEKGAVVVIGDTDGGPNPSDAGVDDQKVNDDKGPGHDTLSPDTGVKPDTLSPDTGVKPDTLSPDTGVKPDTGGTTGPTGILHVSITYQGVDVANIPFTLTCASKSLSKSEVSTGAAMQFELPVCNWAVEVLPSATYAKMTSGALVQYGLDTYLAFALYTKSTCSNSLVPQSTVYLFKGSSVNTSGTFYRCDGSGNQVVIPDSQTTLSVVSGSGVTASGLTLSASTSATDSSVQRCWTSPPSGFGSACQTFTVKVP